MFPLDLAEVAGDQEPAVRWDGKSHTRVPSGRTQRRKTVFQVYWL